MAESKERLIGNQVETKIESPVELTDIRDREVKIPTEVRTWMEKVEQDPGMANTIGDIPTNTAASNNQTPLKVQLSTTRRNFIAGFKKTVDEAGRWLSAFLFRLIKIKDGKVKFKEE